MIFLASTLAGQATYRFFDDGISNLLGVKILTHGTNLFSNLSIRLTGANPDWGGISIGSTPGYDKNESLKLKNTFHVFKDRPEIKTTLSKQLLNWKEEIRAVPLMYMMSFTHFFFIGKRVAPRMHAYMSGCCLAEKFVPQKSSYLLINIFRNVIIFAGGVSNLLFSPTLRFRFSYIDPARFKEDENYIGVAYKTSQKIEAWRIGILGTFLTGINLDWFKRARENPLKILTGLVQLVMGVAIVALGINLVIANPALLVPITVGMALA